MHSASVTLPVSEVYGNTIQGEGPRAGRVCSFIRLGGCNLSCSWCDSAYTWDSSRYHLATELTPMSPEEIMEGLGTAGEVVITGGEPLMHQNNPAWAELLRLLARAGKFISVETNGTMLPTPITQTFVRHYSISPKLENAGSHKSSQNPKLPLWPSSVRFGTQVTSCLKFVVRNADDVQEAVMVAVDGGWPMEQVWVMPEGVEIDEVVKLWPEVAEAAVAEGINCTQRLHVLAWGNKRGV